jgi:Na+/melibiose symporter-like transporter
MAGIFDRISDKIQSVKKKLDERYDFKDERNTSRRNVTVANFSSSIAMNLAGGNFLTGMLLMMHADNAFMGLLSLGGTLANTLNILSPLILEKFPSRKKMLIAVRCFIYFLYIVVVGAVPLFGIADSSKLTIIISTIFIYNIISALTSQGFSIWHIKSIPENIRAKYFSFTSIAGTIIVYPLIILTSSFVDSYKARGMELQAMTALRIAALVFCALDVYFLFKVKEYPVEKLDKPPNLIEVFVNPFKDKRYLRTTLIALLYTLPASIPGPYFSVYLIKDVQVSYTFLNIMGLLSFPVMLISYPLWSRRIQSTSWFRTLTFSMSLWVLPNIINAFITKGSTWMLVVSTVISVMVTPGIGLVFSNLQYINLPPKNQTNFLGFFATVNNMAAFFGTLIGREFIQATEGKDLDLFGFVLQNKQYILLLAASLVLTSATVIRILIKKKLLEENMGSI